MQISRAQPGDASLVSEIAQAAKAHWGYPPEWLEQWREQLTIAPNFIAQNETYVATIDRQIVAFLALRQTPGRMELEHLWVLPTRIGQGVGRALFEHAVDRAAALGATSLTIEADPHAESFYLHMGAKRVGTVQSEVAGLRRELPLLAFELTKTL